MYNVMLFQNKIWINWFDGDLFSLQILDKVHMQFQTFMDDPIYRDQHTVTLELVQMFARVAPNAEPKFREDCKSVVLSRRVQWFTGRALDSRLREPMCCSVKKLCASLFTLPCCMNEYLAIDQWWVFVYK